MNEIEIKTQKGNIFGLTHGPQDGPVIIGIHGWSQNNGSHTWQPMLQPLGDAGFRAISVDMPGWGKSPAWARTAGKSAVVAMLDALETDSAHALMGKSWGGGVAIDFALNFSSRVSNLILTAPAFRGDLSDLGRLTQPVLLAWAKNDETIPYQFGTELAAAMSNVQFESYAEGGHEAAQFNVQDFAPKAINFLDTK